MDMEEYNPFENRNVNKPTNDIETLGHVVKACLGSGVLVMPLTFFYAGIWCGLFATVFVGMIMTLCIHILVKSNHELCHRVQKPSMLYSETAFYAFQDGPLRMDKYAEDIRNIVDGLLCLNLLGACCVSLIFVASGVKQVIDYYTTSDISIRLYMLIIIPFLMIFCQIRTLKHLAPFSMIANILMFIGIVISYYYILLNLPNIKDRPSFGGIQQLPIYFGTVIFNLAGIGLIMHLENSMKNPDHMPGCPGVLTCGMSITISVYTVTGFLGYWKYGQDTKANLVLNFPQDEALAQSVKIIIAAAMFITFGLQFHVPGDIIWRKLEPFIPNNHNLAQILLRISLVMICGSVAIVLPNIGLLLSLIGSICQSQAGIIFPAVIHFVTFWKEPRTVKYYCRFVMDSFLVLFGVLGLLTGTYRNVTNLENVLNDVIS